LCFAWVACPLYVTPCDRVANCKELIIRITGF
jgi:hypothetical protein